MVADPWRIFMRDQHSYLRPIRQHSKAFVAGEGLSAVPLAFGGKEFIQQGGEFRHWDDPDLPQTNWAVRLPPRTATRAIVDLDVDLDPTDGNWTKAREREAAELIDKIIDTIVTIGELDRSRRFGRASLRHDGHLWLPVEFGNKTGLSRLLTLTMRKPIVVGNFRLRIEVRVAPDARQPDAKKAVTLPGSIYKSQSGDGYDVIGWHYPLPESDIPAALPAMAPQPLAGLARGLWAGLLMAVLESCWVEGVRHDTALLVSGVLARETAAPDGFLDEEQARKVLTQLCLLFRDPEPLDRQTVLENTLTVLRSGRPITGYARLAETIGDDAKLALLRLRGGADPDAFASLLENVAYAAEAKGRADAYVDLTMQGHGEFVCSREAIIRHFHPHTHYPAIQPPRGRAIPLIELVLNNRNLPRYHAALDLPGVPFKTVMLNGGDGFRVAEEAEVADLALPRILNVGPGFATTCPEAPEPAAWESWCTLWARHLHYVCAGNPAAIKRVNEAIAWVIQNPLKKIPLGLCFTGDGGIGKSVIFEKILPALIGSHLIGKINATNLEGQHRLGGLEGTLFYCIEEINLVQTNTSIKELLKDLMKNERLRVNRKYGLEGPIYNFAIPVFLTNERDPVLVIRGQAERSLVLIQGDTRERLRLTTEQWDARKLLIARNVSEFLAALQNPAVREAAMFYFKEFIEVARLDFDDNGGLSAVSNPRDALDPIDEAIIGVLEANELHSRLRGVSLTSPFQISWLREGLSERLRERGASRYRLVDHAVARRFNAIFGKDTVQLLRFRDSAGQRRSMHYFTLRYGTLLEKASEHFGFALEPAYELEEKEDFGTNQPSTEDARRAWDTPFGGGGGPFGF